MPFDPATLKYDAQGLIPCIAQDADTGDVLMLAWMNAAAVAQTLATGRVTYWSRSRAAFWVKGESSGHIQELVELRLDCDRDGAGAGEVLLARRQCRQDHSRRRADRDPGFLPARFDGAVAAAAALAAARSLTRGKPGSASVRVGAAARIFEQAGAKPGVDGCWRARSR